MFTIIQDRSLLEDSNSSFMRLDFFVHLDFFPLVVEYLQPYTSHLPFASLVCRSWHQAFSPYLNKMWECLCLQAGIPLPLDSEKIRAAYRYEKSSLFWEQVQKCSEPSITYIDLEADIDLSQTTFHFMEGTFCLIQSSHQILLFDMGKCKIQKTINTEQKILTLCTRRDEIYVGVENGEIHIYRLSGISLQPSRKIKIEHELASEEGMQLLANDSWLIINYPNIDHECSLVQQWDIYTWTCVTEITIKITLLQINQNRLFFSNNNDVYCTDLTQHLINPGGIYLGRNNLVSVNGDFYISYKDEVEAQWWIGIDNISIDTDEAWEGIGWEGLYSDPMSNWTSTSEEESIEEEKDGTSTGSIENEWIEKTIAEDPPEGVQMRGSNEELTDETWEKIDQVPTDESVSKLASLLSVSNLCLLNNETKMEISTPFDLFQLVYLKNFPQVAVGLTHRPESKGIFDRIALYHLGNEKLYRKGTAERIEHYKNIDLPHPVHQLENQPPAIAVFHGSIYCVLQNKKIAIVTFP